MLADSTPGLFTALAPWLSGGAAGALITVAINWGMGAWRRWRLREKMTIEEPKQHRNAVTVRVRNGYVLALTDCWAYISLNYDPAKDIVQPAAGGAHITPDARFPLEHDRLCWSVMSPQGYTGHVDIRPHERQSLALFDIFPPQKCIGIFSETRDNPYRVFLRGDKVYPGTLQIVCREAFMKKVGIKIGPVADSECPVEIYKVQQED
jgi:hypothetical protein